MEIVELKKYIDFSLQTKLSTSGTEFTGSVEARKRWPKGFTYMIGHQPRRLTDEEIEANKITNPNVITYIDADDPYWTDDVGEPLGIDHDNLEILGGNLYGTEVVVGGHKFDIIIENDCGFAVGYASPDLFDLVKKY